MEEHSEQHAASTDQAPGVGENEPSGSFATYTAGLAFALLLTGASFMVSQTNLLWAPGVPAGLVVLAIAQMGVHLVLRGRSGGIPSSWSGSFRICCRWTTSSPRTG